MNYYKNKDGILFPTLHLAVCYMCFLRDGRCGNCKLNDKTYRLKCYDYERNDPEKVVELIGLEKVEVEIK